MAELSGGSDILIAGQPLIPLRAKTESPRVQINVRLFDVAPGRTKQLLTRGTFTLDNGLVGEQENKVEIMIPTYGNMWQAPASHSLRLKITNVDSPYITPSPVP